jgi:2-methylcitrate dehydratase PrpD
MAVALLDRSAGLPQFASERVGESKVQDLLTRVHYVHPPQASGYLNMERTPEQVTIKIRNGAVYSHEVLESKGKPGNPLSEAELIAKFKDCASRALSPERIERSLEMLRGLENIRDINDLMDVLCAQGSVRT